MKKVNKLLICGVILDLLIVVYVQLVIMVIELQKVLNQELNYLSSKITTVLSA